jgi:hypothetical protein
MVAAMREARYPLAAARTLRETARRAAEDALHAARAKHSDAERAVATLQAAVDEKQARRVRTLTPDPTSDRSQRSGADVARSGAYAARLHAELGRLAEQLRAAQATLKEQARAVRLAELAWQQAYAEHEALERHHERFRQAERKAADKADELEVEDRLHALAALQRS